MKRKIAVSGLVIVLFFMAGFGIGHLFSGFGEGRTYPLLGRRVQDEDNKRNIKINFSQLRQELTEYLADQGEIGQQTSVYFEFLSSGVAINLNETQEVVGASLMKVPYVMTMYQLAEHGKLDLDKKIPLKKEWLNDEYGTLYQKGEGYELTLRQAAELALRDSDNTAVLMIGDSVDSVSNPDFEAFNYLDLDYNIQSDGTVAISARSYSSVLKCLYLACHTSNKSSQEMLSYLTKSSFNNRLTRYLPDDLVVAHKIGTFHESYQSDCGIVYHTSGRYILCVMVKGSDPAASDIIADISHEVYLYFKQDE